LPDIWPVRLILISEVESYHTFEFPKFPSEPFFRDLIFVIRAVIAFNDYATYVEVEIVLWAFGIDRFRAEYCIILETIFDEDDVIH